jgi:hypothetical protein
MAANRGILGGSENHGAFPGPHRPELAVGHRGFHLGYRRPLQPFALHPDFIDRNFYSRKYETKKTLEAFSIRLRQERDLSALSDHLARVVRDTMQSAQVSLWLRPFTPPKGRKTD